MEMKKLLSASQFSKINEDWSFAQIDMTNILTNEKLFILENSLSDFHLGIINSDAMTKAWVLGLDIFLILEC